MYIHNNSNLIIYFLYGLALFTMGVSALQQNIREHTGILLLRYIRYLGIFGVIHGVTEFLAVLVNSQIYPELNPRLISFAILLNAISYLFLLAFGIAVSNLQHKIRKKVKIALVVILGLSLGIYLYMIAFNHSFINQWGQYISLFVRYFIALPANIITAVALYKNSIFLHRIRLNAIAFRIRLLSFSFLVYAFLSGVFVKKTVVFPSSLINSELFDSLFGFPVEMARAFTAIIIMVLFISVKEIFSWENNQAIRKLTKEQAIAEERKRLALQVHDVVIQNIYATGLQVEHLLKKESDTYKKERLEDIKDSMNTSIIEIRNYINNIANKGMDFDDLRLNLRELINKLEKLHSVIFIFDYEIPIFTPSQLSPERLSELYFIIREAIYNSIKHAEANKVIICLSVSDFDIIATVKDDGKGFIVAKNNLDSYGLYSMKERAARIDGRLNVSSSNKGTCISLEVPWEVNLDEYK